MANRSGTSRRDSGASAPAPEDTSTAIRYVESSALVAALLERDPEALKSLRARTRRVTSALTLAEAARAIVRARASGRLTTEQERAVVRGLRRFERRCHLVAITDDVLGHVRKPFPVEPLRTLAAVHLATVELLGEPPALVTIVPRDSRVRENAMALGYAIE